MIGEKDVKKQEKIATGTMPNSSKKISERNMGKDGIRLDSNSSVSGVKGGIDQPSASEQGGFHPPTSCYDYCYPGYNSSFTQSDDQGYFDTTGGSYMGIQSDNGSLLYYVPSYCPYPTGFVGVDGKQMFTSSEYLQQPSPYGSDAFSSYIYDSNCAGNVSSGSDARSGSMKPLMVPGGSRKSNGFNHAKSNNGYSNRTSTMHHNSKFQQSTPNFSKPMYQNYCIKPPNKLGSGYQSAGLVNEFHPAGKFPSFSDKNYGLYMQQGPISYSSYGSLWNGRQKSRENFSQSREIECAMELTRGPRGDNRNTNMKLSTGVESIPSIEKNVYNSKDFQIEYGSAKFYVIKSYSEDDIHKSIKYGVWSSTPNGNKKLDAAFREADAKTNEIGVKCPVFLFFSVNGSGQFVGVAEMIGSVNFSKNMDFWQLDKWNGFFPIKWHIIKDVPNALLRHIILESNENRPVTYSRDTQEIGLKQGLEILGIFKNYAEKTSVLEDFSFYENREKLLKAKRSPIQASSQTNGLTNGDFEKHLEAKEVTLDGEQTANNQSDASSLVSLTNNLSINSHTLKSSA